MLSRALALATMMGLIGYCAIGPAQAQENLEAGKNAAQIYTDACSACHKSTHGLLKTVGRRSLAGFLKEHYTTSPAMAALLADYLLSHGADDARYVVGPQQHRAKQATRSESRPTNPIEQLFDSFGHRRNPAPQEATAPTSQPERAPKTDVEPGERETAAHHKRHAGRAEARERAKPGAKEHATSTEPVNARSPEGRKAAAKQHADSHPKPDFGEAPKGTVREAPKPKQASGKTPAEASKSEALKDGRGTESSKSNAGKHATAKVDEGKKPDAKPVTVAPSQSANAEPPKQDDKESKARSASSSGSVLPVTDSHAAAAVAPAEPAATPPIVSAAAPPPVPPATTASAPPAGRPVPPISH
ncbi:MAG: hypothetical protein ACREDC_04910 [Bradyrhizobium sp.]